MSFRGGRGRVQIRWTCLSLIIGLSCFIAGPVCENAVKEVRVVFLQKVLESNMRTG